MKSVVIAAGGTGGHIYPALAVADALKKSHPELQIFFVGTPGGLENKLVPTHGYPLLHIPIGRLHKSVSKWERLKTLLQLPFALLKAANICLQIRPQFLLGVGGHASGPMLLAGSLLRFETVIWEPNAHPGLANRILSRFVSRCFVVFENAKAQLRSSHVEKVGFPIRKVIEDLGVLKKHSDGGFRLLVYGGSQGALGLSRAVLQFLQKYRAQYDHFEVVLQTGPAHYQIICEEAKTLNLSSWSGLKIVEYIHDMEAKYRWCDLVIARAGTGTISELAATGRPSLLVPLPTSADGHQQRNAEALLEKGAAFMILQNELTADSIHMTIQKFLNDESQREKMTNAIRAFHVPHAAEQIAARLFRGDLHGS